MSGILRSLQQPLSIVLAAGCVTIATPVAAQQASPRVQKSAVDAASRMGEYLRSLKSFEVTSDVTLSAIEEGEKTQTQMKVTYKVRRPNAFVIDAVSDRKSRRFIYDGRSFTVFAPKVGYFATVSAPPTINQTAEVIYQTYGVALPLADLFYWGRRRLSCGWRDDRAEGGDRADRRRRDRPLSVWECGDLLADLDRARFAACPQAGRDRDAGGSGQADL